MTYSGSIWHYNDMIRHFICHNIASAKNVKCHAMVLELDIIMYVYQALMWLVIVKYQYIGVGPIVRCYGIIIPYVILSVDKL